MTVTLRTPRPEDEAAFIAAARRSQDVHHPWTTAPSTPDEYQAYLKKYQADTNIAFLAVNEDDQLIGCININQIIRGRLNSAFLGYFGFVPFLGQGLMKRALTLAITEAFTTHELHRLEANIQPGNEASLRLIRTLGFRHEGFSPRYLYLNEKWRDHERFAITAEEWPTKTTDSDVKEPT